MKVDIIYKNYWRKKMKCNKSCCHYPCTRIECGEDKNCKEYKSIIQEAIEFINQANKEVK